MGKPLRKHIRFLPEPGTCALIDTRPDPEVFEPKLTSLVYNESYSGCAVVIHSTKKLQPGDICWVQISTLRPLRAEVRWRKELDSGIARVGLSYIEDV
jgi:hypothetical protein